jgi:glyoxylase-like metal-dependent hydrolase (beta-lactamase superfamily II)
MKAGDPPSRVGPTAWGVPLAARTLPPWDATNAYVVGSGGVGWLVDPGAGDPASIDALAGLVAAAGVRTLKGVLVTHAHPDHVAGLEAVVARWSLESVFAHPLALASLPAGLPLRPLQDGRRLMAGGSVVEALATPGHAPDHLAFLVDDGASRTLVAGDLVAGRGSIWIGTPDGDVAAYLDSLARAAARAPDAVAPGHGPVRHDAGAVLDEARRHRLAREGDVWAALAAGPRTLAELCAAIYGELDPAVAAFAERSLLAHLRKLMHETRVVHVGSDEQGPYARRAGG